MFDMVCQQIKLKYYFQDVFLFFAPKKRLFIKKGRFLRDIYCIFIAFTRKLCYNKLEK